MVFTKMHGIGNDYVYINAFKEKIANPEELAIKVSNRNYGIGSDGLVLICPSEVADFQMKMYNSDGTPSEMCGNGIRCVGKYVYDYGLTDKTKITVETLGGIKTLDLIIENGKVDKVKVDMGSPILEAIDIPMKGVEGKAIDYPIMVGQKEYKITAVSMGNPHGVVFLEDGEDLEALPLEEIGPLFEHHQLFPNRVNTEFVKVIDRSTAKMRVWERGAGETLACGTGACAVAVACMLNSLTENIVTVKLLGGDLLVEWDRKNNKVYMTGPAQAIFDGVLF